MLYLCQTAVKRLAKSKSPVLRRRVFPSLFTPDKQPNRHNSHSQRDQSGNDKGVLNAHRGDPWCVDEHYEDGETVTNEDNPNESIAENLDMLVSFSILSLPIVLLTSG